jgi:hypothetical protein
VLTSSLAALLAAAPGLQLVAARLLEPRVRAPHNLVVLAPVRPLA